MIGFAFLQNDCLQQLEEIGVGAGNPRGSRSPGVPALAPPAAFKTLSAALSALLQDSCQRARFSPLMFLLHLLKSENNT